MKFARTVLALFALTALASCAPDEASETTVYLVRHAEKVDSSRDPALSPAGEARAAALADRLADAGVTHIHSSDYIRTRETAAPLAERLGLDVQIYDAGDLPAIAARLQDEPGPHLVVGHSNTTPQLVELLGGVGGAPIVEATEYDRLYRVALSPDRPADTVLMRYGAPSP